MLSGIERGIKKTPIKMIIYGPDGVGKTHMAKDAPNPIFMDIENGTTHLDVARAPKFKDYKEFLAFIKALTDEPHEYKTLVIDSIDWLETNFIWPQVCKDGGKPSIEEFGYGKGYVLALGEWQNLLRGLNRLQEKTGMNVIMIAHSEIRAFNDPITMNPYDRYQLKLHAKAAAYLREYVDSVLFATYEVFTKTAKEGVKVKAYGDGERVLYTERRPSHDAKNRIGLPEKIPLSWKAYAEYADKGSGESADGIIQNIYDLTLNIQDNELKDKIEATIVAAKGDTKQLERIRDKVRIRLGVETT